MAVEKHCTPRDEKTREVRWNMALNDVAGDKKIDVAGDIFVGP